MTHVVRVSMKDLEKTIKRDMKALERTAKRAIRKTARDGLNHINHVTAPVAFAELRASGHLEGTGGLVGRKDGSVSIVYDAPHAAAVENGSRPHMPPVEPLIRWVKLRAMQGISGRGNTTSRNLTGSTSEGAATEIAARMRHHERLADNASGAFGVVTGADAARKIAWAIAMTIKKRGTRPHWFVGRALPWISARLRENMGAAFEDFAPDADVAAE